MFSSSDTDMYLTTCGSSSISCAWGLKPSICTLTVYFPAAKSFNRAIPLLSVKEKAETMVVACRNYIYGSHLHRHSASCFRDPYTQGRLGDGPGGFLRIGNRAAETKDGKNCQCRVKHDIMKWSQLDTPLIFIFLSLECYCQSKLFGKQGEFSRLNLTLR